MTALARCKGKELYHRVKGVNMEQVKKRENWSSRFGMLMSLAGMAIGLGNCWRFPYLVGAYGGGAFVVAYLICLLVIVVPLGLLEAGIGKGLQGGNIDAWRAILKNRTGGNIVGAGFSIAYAVMNFFYMSVTATAVYFMYVFATGLTSREAPELIYDNLNSTTNPLLILTIIVTLLLIFIIYLGVVNGVEKASKIFIPAIFVIFLIIIVFAAVSIPGIAEGYNFYLNPDWSQLARFDLWKTALGQALFSVGVGPGCVLVYGSHIKKSDDCVLGFLTVAILDTCAALLAGFAIIPTCVALGLNPESGSGLVYIVLPKALSQIPMGNVLGVLVMFAIFFAAMSSAIAQMQIAITSFEDGFGWNHKFTVLLCGVITFIMACVCVVNKAQFDFWNNFAGNYAFIVCAAIGGVGYTYIFGVKKVREFLNEGAWIHIGSWFEPLVKFVACPLMLIIMIDSLFPFLG